MCASLAVDDELKLRGSHLFGSRLLIYLSPFHPGVGHFDALARIRRNSPRLLYEQWQEFTANQAQSPQNANKPLIHVQFPNAYQGATCSNKQPFRKISAIRLGKPATSTHPDIDA